MTDLATALKLISAQAVELRRSGVRSLKIGDVEVSFEAPEPEPPPAPTRAEIDAQLREQVPADPFDDPMTYPGGVVPRLPDRAQQQKRQPRDEHEDDDDE